MPNKKTILVAPLHWGLGHASRCIPIIRDLLKNDYDVIIASDGEALLFLKKEFPKLDSIELPSYDIRYSNKSWDFKWSIIKRFPNLIKAIKQERDIVERLVLNNRINGVISDNRFGVYSSKIPSIYITHQLNVLSGSTTFLSSKKHRNMIKNFDECWVPDHEGINNLSGRLSHDIKDNLNIKYIGPLSRMKQEEYEKKYDILFILSGPEPQREYLEEIIIKEFADKPVNSILVRGVIENGQTQHKIGNIKIINYLLSSNLEKMINMSELIVSRSGYSTIMDLAVMGKKAFFIPTPGQYEQEYLAKRMKTLGIAPSCRQKNFSYEKLKEVSLYTGFKIIETNNDFKELYSLFECE